MNKRVTWHSCRMIGRGLTAALLLAAAQTAVAATAVEEASTLLQQGQLDQALKKLDAQLKSQPQDAQARFLRGLVLVRLNRSAEAVKMFADLTRDYPQLPEPYNNLAVLYAQQGDYEKARDALEAALATHPSYATAHENLGDIYAALAGAAYNRALSLDGANQGVRSKLALIGQLDGQGSTSVATAPTISTPPPAAAVPASVPPASTVPAPPPSAPAAAAPTVDAATAASVTSVINAWAAAWSSQDLNAYFATYSPSFVPEGGLGRSAWEAQRRDRISRAKSIQVKALNPVFSRLAADRLSVSFNQSYVSDSFSDSTQKTLELQQAGSSWLIAREYSR
ncbi:MULTISPECIES: tetratricopeptide repeat protein [Hydrocarboniphaga]|nr:MULTISPECIES: tetratricopeptide repeat protein [Hydrocarboniphaga]MDZ4079709.1 tetratricopeptide repeat protein [Hydrocarboniphaga sp.]